MPKLTDTQLVILSAAAGRDDRCVLPLPKSLKIKGAALTKTLDGLRKKDLLAEVPATAGAATWREVTDGQRMMLVITDTGVAAIDGGASASKGNQPASGKTVPGKRRDGRRVPDAKPGPRRSVQKSRRGTKQDLLIELLQRKTGASIDEIIAATGWQAHSVRGAISGTIKKKLGLAIASEKIDSRGRVYRIVAQG